MPVYSWATDPMDLIRPFESRLAQPDAAALFAWAAWSVDSLHYLADVDHDYDISHSVVGGHRPDVVDVAHARWATGTCITSLDLCAAGVGRAYCGYKSAHELALPNFDPSNKRHLKRVEARRAALPPAARQWIDVVLADPRYAEIKAARDWLVHSRIRRHFTLAAGGPPQRLRIDLATTRPGVRQVVEDARDLATQSVSRLLAMLPHL